MGKGRQAMKTVVSDEALKEAIDNLCTDQILERLRHLETIRGAGSRGLEALSELLRYGTARERGIAIIQIPRMMIPLYGYHFAPKAFENMLACFETCESPSLRRRLMQLLVQMLRPVFDKLILRRLYFSLLDEDMHIRRYAIQFINEHNLREAVPYLQILLDDDESYIQRLAAECLAHLHCNEANFALREWEGRKTKV
jgi:hypothetical protein